RVIEATCEPGGMIAIFDSPALHAREALLRQHCEIAGVNFSSHFVVSGPQARLDIVETFLHAREITFQRLPVSYAFHSQWIDPAAAPYLDFLRTLPMRAPAIPIACCAEGALLKRLPPDYFWSVARRPICFEQTIHRLDAEGPFEYIDVGPSSSLAAFLKYVLPSESASSRHAILKTVGRDLDNLAALLRRSAPAPMPVEAPVALDVPA
ncbi:MAG: acyltransferase domain-containing protein, partial [Gammaproteobacteria bacterium]